MDQDHVDQHQHGHGLPHPHGRLFEVVYVGSMVFGRGGMARAVADLANVSSGDVVVDVGCGPGTAARRARRAGAARVVAVDPDPHMLRLARWISAVRRTEGVAFVEGSAESLPVDSGTATVLWAIQSVHHWRDRGQGLKEALRVLAPGGRLILLEGATEPNVRGRAKHGMTERQAAELEAVVAEMGFTDLTRRLVPVRRRNFVAIRGSAPTP